MCLKKNTPEYFLEDNIEQMLDNKHLTCIACYYNVDFKEMNKIKDSEIDWMCLLCEGTFEIELLPPKQRKARNKATYTCVQCVATHENKKN